MHISRKSIGCFAAAILATSVWTMADDVDTLAKAPAAVQATVKKVLGDKKCEGFDKEDAVDGKPAYELSFKVDGADHSVIIVESGDVVEEEADVDLSKVPAPVIDAAKKAHADGKMGDASIVTANGKSLYELDVKVGKDSHEMRINADGTVVSDKIEKPESDEKDKDEKDEKDEKKEGKDKD